MTKYGQYKNKLVPLEKPIRSGKGSSKFMVYVRNKKTGNINIVRFGSRKYTIKKHIKQRKKSYCARSGGIKTTKPMKLSPNYWSRKMWGC